MDKHRIKVIAQGRVQGVFYRDTTRTLANSVGATGWIRNLPDGKVEALIEGTEEQLSKVLAFMERGPSRAHVESLDLNREEEATGEFENFKIRFDY